MKTLKTLIAGSVMAAVIALAPAASALLITPASLNVNGVSSGEGQTNPLNATQAESILGLASGTLTEVYKSNVGGIDEGSFAANYATTFSNTATDPSDALITHTGGAFITGSPIWLGVKDGNHSPWFYLFDISSWNGTENIELSGFWPNGGAISHVSIFTGEGTSVPDAGTSVLLLGAGLLGIGALRRRLAK